jgi:hypothetical protein
LTREGFETSIREGGTGQFDVVRDDEVVFSKRAVKRFPQAGEVLSLLRG